jgi:hypothetical protein
MHLQPESINDMVFPPRLIEDKQDKTMTTTYVLRQSESLIFDTETETFTFSSRNLKDAQRRAIRKQYGDANLRLEDENGKVVSIKRSGFKWEDKV